jgi:hypothetical protein
MPATVGVMAPSYGKLRGHCSLSVGAGHARDSSTDATPAVNTPGQDLPRVPRHGPFVVQCPPDIGGSLDEFRGP